MTDRPTPLGITQDADCVTWGHLTALREKYNLIWDKLTACALAEGDRYGDGSIGKKHETAALPTISGFFRLTINSTLVGADYVCTPGDIHFILAGGTLLDRINDTEYSYFADGSPFSVVLKEACNNCSKFYPTSYGNAEKTISCPSGNSINLYTGFYQLGVGSAPAACAISRDWGDSPELLQDHIEMFETSMPASEGVCSLIIESCCELYDVAHYEDDGNGMLVLKYIDIFVDDAGNAAMTGYMTTPIQASDLSEIKDRVTADMDHFMVSEDYVCDDCGGLYPALEENPDECTTAGKTHISCIAALSTSGLLNTAYVAGVSPVFPGSCLSCEQMAGAIVESFVASRTICTCEWEQLAGVLQFLIDYGCVKECTGGTKCPGEIELNLSYVLTQNVANAWACGVLRGDGKIFKYKDEEYSYSSCYCFGGSPTFNCDYTEHITVTGDRIKGCGDCGDTTSTADPQRVPDCLNDNCPGDVNAQCDDQTLNEVWTDEITPAELVAFAEVNMGTTDAAQCCESTVIDAGVTDRVVCGKTRYAGDGSATRITYLNVQAEKSDPNLGSYYYYRDTLVITLSGADISSKTVTLYWKESTNGGADVDHSEVFSASNSWQITLTPTVSYGQTGLIHSIYAEST